MVGKKELFIIASFENITRSPRLLDLFLIALKKNIFVFFFLVRGVIEIPA